MNIKCILSKVVLVPSAFTIRPQAHSNLLLSNLHVLAENVCKGIPREFPLSEGRLDCISSLFFLTKIEDIHLLTHSNERAYG